MGEAFVLGLVSTSSLVIGSLVTIWLHISLRAVGLIMGFGAGVLILAVAFERVVEAAEKSSGGRGVAIGPQPARSSWHSRQPRSSRYWPTR